MYHFFVRLQISQCHKSELMFSVKKSKVPVDLIQFPDSDGDTGLGLWQHQKGSFSITVAGPDIESIRKSDIHLLQKPFIGFQSSFDEDYILVPTVYSVTNGIVPFVFRIQHSVDPTHKLDYEDDHRDYPWSYPKLVPKKSLDSNTEITFNYNC